MLDFESFFLEARHTFDYKEWGVVDIENKVLYNGKEHDGEGVYIELQGKGYTHEVYTNEMISRKNAYPGEVIQYFIPSYDNVMYLRYASGSGGDTLQKRGLQIYETLRKTYNDIPLAEEYYFEMFFVYEDIKIRARNLNDLIAKLRDEIQNYGLSTTK